MLGATINGKRERQEAILHALGHEGRVDVSKLAINLGVSAMTVRRDMAELNRRGLIQRVHGGATTRQQPSIRAAVMRNEKLALARWVSEHVEDDDFLALDVGSTCTAVAHELNSRGKLTILSNSLNALQALDHPSIERLCVGGQINAEGSIIPHDAVTALEPFVVDKVILGCGGISLSAGITYQEIAETFFRRALLRRASEVILVADHTKLGRESRYSLGPLSAIDTLATTKAPDGALADGLSQAGVNVEVISPPE